MLRGKGLWVCFASVCEFVVTRKTITAGGVDVCTVILGDSGETRKTPISEALSSPFGIFLNF